MISAQRVLFLGLFLSHFTLPMYVSHSKSHRINRNNNNYQALSAVKKEPVYTDLEVFVKSGISFTTLKYLAQKEKIKITGAEKKRDDAFAAAELLACVPGNVQERITHYLLPGSQRAQILFLTQPAIDALCHYSASELLSKSVITQQPIHRFFTMNDEQRQIVGLMYNHFAQPSATSIDIDRKMAFVIGGLDEDIKEEFKNSKEFFVARIMPDTEDKLLRLGVSLGKGAVLGAMAAAGVTVCHDYGRRVAKEVMRTSVSTLAEGALVGATMSLLIGKPQLAARIAMTDAWNEQEQITLNSFGVLKEGAISFKKVLMKDMKKEVVNEFRNSVFDYAEQTSIVDVNRENVLKNAKIGALAGAACSGCSALWSINEPLQIISISKM